jgi:GT2 family glycosyltransferase
MTPTAVAIVNYNTRDLLRACLATVLREGPDEVVVIDNASHDGSAEMVRAAYPSIKLCANGTNSGYGTAANQAVLGCTSRRVLLLNSDAQLPPGALGALSAYQDQHPQAAVVGPRLVNPDGTLQQSCFPFPTPLDVFLDVSNLSRLVGRMPVLHRRYLRAWRHTHARQVPWLVGAAWMIRRDAFEAVGGFDSSFFMYYEEVDLCYRLAQAGWQIHFTPVTDVVHVGGASTQQRRADMAVQFFASLAQFYDRYYSPIQRAELGVLVECTAFARLVRDTLWMRLAQDSRRRSERAANVTAWRRLLLGEWRRHVVTHPLGEPT